uniref:Vitronectin a n=1 Tax=Cyprinus carpio TaxID=7962 RepID=A0A8C2FQT3_CYPCA
MMRLFLLLGLISFTYAAESCIERCENGFDATKSFQCDSMCTYYKSCCKDYESLCRIRTRGDTFPSYPEDDYEEINNSTEVPIRSRSQHKILTPSPATFAEIFSLLTPASQVLDSMLNDNPSPEIATAANPTTHFRLASSIKNPTTTPPKDPDAEVCSGRPFDSFMQLKNGSLYAFRGQYFFELDEKSVLPGYPKLIEDLWGIKGPIDFTCINCQGKTYIFKGKKYWRFEDGIPDHLDAAFAIPAHSHHGKEKVYFFKGDQYYHYEFKHHPSHEECIQMSLRSPSALFQRYTNIYYDRWVEHFNQLFGGGNTFLEQLSHHNGHHFINKDWTGIKSPVDAVLVGRLYITPRWPSRRRQDRYRQDWDQQWGQQYTQQWDQRYGQPWDQHYGQQWDQWGFRCRQNRSPYWETMAERDMYYRVNLRTKRVDYANSPYPRPIGKYWLGCKDKPGAEKR